MRDAVRPLRMWVWLGILAGLGWTAARVAVPWLTGEAIDEGIVPGNFDVALKWTGIILAVGVIQAICTGLRRYAAFRLAYRVETESAHAPRRALAAACTSRSTTTRRPAS